jgi:pimeloyl-ACP methyl ester carboxylesterase
MNFNSLYHGASQRKSAFDLTYSPVRKNRDLVIFCHGYKGFKDWGPWNLMASYFAEEGCDFLKFNFSHNGGTADNPIDFPDTAAFAENTYSKELEDLEAMIEMAHNGFKVNGRNIDYDRIHLIGHSRGGGIAILAASRFSEIEKLITWAAVSDFGERFEKYNIQKWKEEGVTYVQNSRTKQMLPHNYSFYTDYLENIDTLDISAAAKRVNTPWLVVHGDEDEAVCISNADYLNCLNRKSSLLIMKEAGHTFGGSHPWNKKSLPEKLQAVAENTLDFITA